jgi:outer membrane biosynthesis protein TonB
MFHILKMSSKFAAIFIISAVFNANAQINIQAPKVEAPKIQAPKVEAPKVEVKAPTMTPIPTPVVKLPPKPTPPPVPKTTELTNAASAAAAKAGNLAQVKITNDFATKISGILKDKSTDATGGQISKGNVAVECTKGKNDKDATCTFKPASN